MSRVARWLLAVAMLLSVGSAFAGGSCAAYAGAHTPYHNDPDVHEGPVTLQTTPYISFGSLTPPGPNGDCVIPITCPYGFCPMSYGLGQAAFVPDPPPNPCGVDGDSNGGTDSSHDYYFKKPGVRSGCLDGCLVGPVGHYRDGTDSSGAGYTVWEGLTRQLGPGGYGAPRATCTEGDAPGDSPPVPPAVQPPPAPQPPPPGKCDGQVNGVTVRVDCTKSSSGQTGSSSSGSSGGADNGAPPNTQSGDTSSKNTSTSCDGANCTTTTTTTTTHSDGSKDTTTTTTNVNGQNGSGSSTTTKSGTNADGTLKPTTTANDAGSEMDTCKLHPDAKGCSGGGTAVFGDCATPPVCDGDAIACAIAAEEHRFRCADQKRFDDLNGLPSTDLGTALVAGNDPQKGLIPDASAPSSTVDVGTLDDAGFLGGGACFADKTVTVFGKPAVISFSQFCGPLGMLKYFSLAIGGIVALGILRSATIGPK